MTFRPILLSLVALSLCVRASGAEPCQQTEDSDAALAYIERYLAIAVEEMDRVGVPASITIAQGMLESAYGKSELATNANNHFGIKCHKGWSGETYYHKTEEYKENGFVRGNRCFRKYATARQSYVDHSNFLRSRAHYESLFEMDHPTYKKWAVGLFQAGYATDPTYANKLIQVIEKYKLSKYDSYTDKIAVKHTRAGEVDLLDLKRRVERLERILVEAELHQQELLERQAEFRNQIVAMQQEHQSQHGDLNAKIRMLDENIAKQRQIIKKMQGSLNNVEQIQQNILKSDPLAGHFNDDGTPRLDIILFPRKQKNAAGVFYQSGRKATTIEEGETLFDIANRHDIAYRHLLKYNDLTDDNQTLPEGCYIYLEPKANYNKNVENNHQVQIGETMHSISQRYGIKLSKLYQRNNLDEGQEPEVSEFISLNKNSNDTPKLKPESDVKEARFGGGGVKRKK